MVKPLVSIVITNWNGLPFLKKCLGRLAKITYPNYETILIDNLSSDESVNFVKENFPRTKIIINQKNLGFAESCNIGYQKSRGEFILLLNNDVEVTPDFLNLLVTKLIKDKQVAVIQPRIIFKITKRLQSGTSYLLNTGFLYHYGYNKNPDDPKYNKTLETFSANGGCILIRRSVIDKIGLFDSDFFAYFEESDFCWRVWLAGYKIIYFPKSLVYHYGAQTSQKFPLDYVYFHSFRNRIASMIKNLNSANLLRILPVHIFLSELFSLLMILRLNFFFLIGVQKALLWNIVNLGNTLKKRKTIQEEIRKLSDKEIFNHVLKKVRLSFYYYNTKGLEYYEDEDF